MKNTTQAVEKLHLFNGARQHENFSNLKNLLPVTEMQPSPEPFVFPRGENVTLPDNFDFANRQVRVDAFLDRTDTAGLLVLQDSRI